MKVMIETVVVFPPAFESRKIIDWTKNSDRKFLMNHLTWCLHNGRRVTMEVES